MPLQTVRFHTTHNYCVQPDYWSDGFYLPLILFTRVCKIVTYLTNTNINWTFTVYILYITIILTMASDFSGFIK